MQYNCVYYCDTPTCQRGAGVYGVYVYVYVIEYIGVVIVVSWYMVYMVYMVYNCVYNCVIVIHVSYIQD
jgi:hypothetical protein